MTQDILILILPHLSTQDASELLDVILSKEVLTNPDNGVQKRGYKILARLVEASRVSLDVGPMINRLDELSDGLSPAAKKVHFRNLRDLACNRPWSNPLRRIGSNCMRTCYPQSPPQLCTSSHR
jgi:ribosomal RNA-processing protein 12